MPHDALLVYCQKGPLCAHSHRNGKGGTCCYTMKLCDDQRFKELCERETRLLRGLWRMGEFVVEAPRLPLLRLQRVQVCWRYGQEALDRTNTNDQGRRWHASSAGCAKGPAHRLSFAVLGYVRRAPSRADSPAPVISANAVIPKAARARRRMAAEPLSAVTAARARRPKGMGPRALPAALAAEC